jgi:hypothetical protein
LREWFKSTLPVGAGGHRSYFVFGRFLNFSYNSV